MGIDIFANKFREQFIDGDSITVLPETAFRQLPSWDSLTGMSVLVMIQDEYGVEITDEELKQTNTVEELFNVVNRKKNA